MRNQRATPSHVAREMRLSKAGQSTGWRSKIFASIHIKGLDMRMYWPGAFMRNDGAKGAVPVSI